MNQGGAITLDFIFAMVLVLSMTFLLGVFSFSLAIIEGAQYITFSASRSYFASHISEQKQKELAEQKFNNLKKSKGLENLLSPNIVSLDLDRIGDAGDIYKRQDYRDVLEGVRSKVTVEMLSVSLPGLGGTGNDSFETFMTSFIGRESTTEECFSFVQGRFQALIGIPEYSSPSIQSQSYFPFDDNGC